MSDLSTTLIWISIGCNIAIILLYVPVMYYKVRIWVCDYKLWRIKRNKMTVSYRPETTKTK